jgi:prepilin-type processing-associated H-X9-DG protein
MDDEGVVVVNERCQIRVSGGRRVVVVSGVPVHPYAGDDVVAEAYAMVFLADSGLARQREVAKAFGRSERTVQRHRQRYAEGGMAALALRVGWRPGRRRLKAKRLCAIERCKAEGMSNRAIAARLGVTEAAIRKQVGPAETPAQQQVIPFPVSPAATGEEAPLPSGADTVAKEAPVAGPKLEALTEGGSGTDSEPVPMSLDVDPGDRRLDRLLACFGLVDDAAPVFADATGVPGVGVLFAVPLLLQSGILGIARKLYGELGPAFYGLRTTVLTLLLMALLRVKRAEGLKERDPVALGRLIGLDRAPEMKTLRRKLARLAACHRAEQLVTELARRRVELRGQAAGFLYVDGHVRVYHGKRKLPKAHVARMRIALPATTDYWVNDQRGDPLLVITAEANAGLVTMLPRITRDIRGLVGERRVTVVFDRGGWSPKLFCRLVADGFDILTYRKGSCRKVAEHRFVLREAVLDGRSIAYRLHDQEISLLKGKLQLRQVTRLCDDGHQTQVVTSRRDLTDIEVAYRMFERWRQENFFKYMREEFLLDALVDYNVEPDDPTRTVPNPARKVLDTKIRAAKADIATLEQKYGAAAFDNPESKRPTMRGFKIAHGMLGKKLRAAKQLLADLLAERRATPARVEVRDVSPGEVVKLANERKRLTDVFKIVAYQAESDLLALLRPLYARADDEGRTLLHELFAASGSIEVTANELRVTVAPLSAPHRTAAVAALCETLNLTATIFPGTNLRLVLAVQSDDRKSMAFPGARAQSGSQQRPAGPEPDTSRSG